MTALETALAWQAAGHYVLPGLKGEKSSYVHYVRDGLDRPSADQVREWFTDSKAAEVLVVPGRATTPLLVVDVDVKADGTNGFDSLEARGLEGVDRGAGQSSRSGNGEHHWYQADSSIGPNGSPGNVVAGVDVRSHNGLVSVTHYPETIRPAEVTDAAPSWAVKPYGGTADGATRGLDIIATLKDYREPGKPSSEAQAAGAAILADGQGHEAVKGPLKRLVMAVLEGQPGAFRVYKDARERWGSHPEADLEVSWDSHVRAVIVKALKARPMDPDYLPTRAERLKARAKIEADLEEFEEGLDEEDAEGLTVEERQREAAVRERVAYLSILDEAKERHEEAKNAGRPTIRERMFPALSLRERPAPVPLIEGVLDKSNTSMIYGAPATGKSFVALHWAWSVATGQPWLGREVEAGKVLYIAAEGDAGLGARMEALRRAWPGDEGDRLWVHDEPVDLTSSRDVAELASIVAELAIDLVVFDTFARVAGGSVENSNDEAQRVMSAADTIRRAHPGCTALIVHHEGKTGDMRGASSILGALDIALRLHGEGESKRLEFRKRKEGPLGLVTDLVFQPVDGTTSGVMNGTRAHFHREQANTDELLAAFAEAFPEGGSRQASGPIFHGAGLANSDRNGLRRFDDLKNAGLIEKRGLVHILSEKGRKELVLIHESLSI